MLPLNTVVNGDCLEAMKGVPDSSVNLIVTDPPYYKICQESWDKQWDTYGEYLKWLNCFIDESYRVLSSDGSMYIFSAVGDSFNKYTDMIYKTSFCVRNMIVWWRETPGFKQSIKRFTINYELIWFLTKSDDYVWNLDDVRVKHWRKFDKRANPLGKSPGSIWYEFNLKIGRHKEATTHPTQKPLRLIERMISASSNINSIVLDPFLGSGTTALACEKLQRKWIGIEISKEYCNIANKRLEQLRGQTRLDTL